MTLTYYSEFAGAGGDTIGAAAVPGVEPIFAANHDRTVTPPVAELLLSALTEAIHGTDHELVA